MPKYPCSVGAIKMKHNKTFIIMSVVLLLSFPLMQTYAENNSGIVNLRQTSKAFASVAKKVSPSVVFIQVESVKKDLPYNPFASPFGDDLFKRFFGDTLPGIPKQQQTPTEKRIMGQGSGFVFSTKKSLLANKSYIVTNNHVVESADKIHITFKDSREYEAKVVGTDPKSDIAVLEIKDTSHPALNMGNSSVLEVGEWVIAVGNPFGLSHTLTVGVVSAKGRTGLGINDYEDFIQTDAAINPGNSGGPLLNLDGEVIGINTAIFSRSGGYMGVGFAIPVNLVNNIVSQLIEHGEVTRGYLGVMIQQMTPDLFKSFGLREHNGILISQVSENSPADKAGLRAGDVIVRYQGKKVTEVGDFRNQVALTAPGSKANLSVIRNGKTKDIAVVIGNLKKEPESANSSTQLSEELGLVVQTITPDIAKQFNVKAGQGVVVSNVMPGSLAAMAGLRPGVVILQVDRAEVSSATQFKQAIDKSRKNKQVLFLLQDLNMARYVIIKWP